MKTNRTFQPGDQVFIKIYDDDQNLVEIQGIVTKVESNPNYQGGFIEIKDADGGIIQGSTTTIDPSHQRTWKNVEPQPCLHPGCEISTRSKTKYCRKHRPHQKYR